MDNGVEPQAHDYMHRLLDEKYDEDARDKMAESCVMSTSISLKRIADFLDWWKTATLRGELK